MPLDAPSAGSPRSRAEPLLAGFALAVALGIAALVLLARLGASQTWIDGGYWAMGIAVAAAIAMGSGARRPSLAAPVFGGLAIASATVSAAFFLALAGAIFAWGHDGLAFPLGLGAGCLLLQLTIAPRLAQSGARSLLEFFAVRYPGRAARMASAAVAIISMLTLLVAELMAAGLIGVRLLGIDYAAATIVAAGAVLACFVVRAAGGGSLLNGLLFPVLLVALLVPLVQLSATWYDLPLPQLAYANALWQVQGLEETLLEQELADPAYMKPMLTAFVSLTPTNFLGIVLGLAVGVAALPSLLGEQLLAARPAREARWSALWGLIFVVLLLTLVPAVAAYAKLSVATLIADRTPTADLPAWIFTYGKLGFVHICGRAATDAAAVAQACAALPDVSTALRLHDLALDPDIVTLALPEITGLDPALLGLIAAAGLATALATAHGPLGVIVGALIGDRSAAAGSAPRTQRFTSYGIAAAMLAAAAFGALARPAGIIEVATWAFTLAAAGLFPALFAALWWHRASAEGAAAAMLAGLVVTLIYLLGTHYFAVPFFEATSGLSSAGPSGQEYFAELKKAWLAAEPGAAKEAAWAALDAHARSSADWWGISSLAAALLALPAGIAALVVVSLVTPPPRGTETAP